MDQDLVGRVMADMDPDLLTFLRTKVNSFIKWDLIHFFYENVHATDTAENIAHYTGRSVETTEAELAELAANGVVNENRLGDMIVYSLTNDPAIRDLLNRFIEASGSRQFRVKAIYHIVRGMQ